MGVEAFYLNVQIDSSAVDSVKDIINGKKIYGQTLNYYFTDNAPSELCLQASMVSFYSMCEVIYKLCDEISRSCSIGYIETLKNKQEFNFTCAFDFMKWMYENWKEKIESFNKEWGIFSVKPSAYYKSRKKLNKKYFYLMD